MSDLPIPGVPAIPQPTVDPKAMLFTLMALKEAVEVLSGQRGTGDHRAATLVEVRTMMSTLRGELGL